MRNIVKRTWRNRKDHGNSHVISNYDSDEERNKDQKG